MNILNLLKIRNLIMLLVLLLVFVIPFLYSNDLLDISLHIRLLALNIWLLITTLIILLYRKEILKNFKINTFFTLFGIYLIYSIVSIFISDNYFDALFQFNLILCQGVTILLCTILFSNQTIDNTKFAIIFNVLAFIVLILGFKDYIEILIQKGITHQSIYSIKAGFSHKNIFSEVLFVLLPFSIYNLFSKNKSLFVLSLVNSIGIIFLMIILITRAIWIATLLGLIISFVILFLIKGKVYLVNILKNRRIYYMFLSFVSVILFSIFVYSQLDSFETLKKSSQKIFKAYDSSQHRLELWKRSIKMAEESPFYGKGLGSWRIEVLKYGNNNLQSEDNVTFYQRPHNDYLWILSEQGIIGLIFWVLLYGIILYYMIMNIKTSLNQKEVLFNFLILFVFIGYLIFSFFSFPRERIEHIIFLGLSLGFVIAKYHSNRKIQEKKGKGLNLFILLIILLILLWSSIFAYSRYNSEKLLHKAFECRNNKDWDGVINEITKAETRYYKIDPLSTPLLWYRGEAYFELGDLKNALNDYEKSYKLNPYHIHVLNNLATCYEIGGNHFKATVLYKKAIHISPKFEDALLNLSAVYFNNGLMDSAYFTINKIEKALNTERYNNNLLVILKAKINFAMENTDNEEYGKVMTNISKNNDWILNIFEKSKLKCINFDKQLILDCAFVLNQAKDTEKN